MDVRGPLSGRAVVADLGALGDPDIDVVHVAAANDLHLPLAKAALAAGKHVVCEKPLAMDAAGAAELAALARTSGRCAAVCNTYRFRPLAVDLASRVRTGELGAVHLARGSYLQDWLLLESASDWRLDRARGGLSRAVADIGVHWLDLVEWTTGQTVEAVAAQLGQLHLRQTEDHAGLLVRYETQRKQLERSQAWSDKQLARMHRGMEVMAKDLAERPWCHGERYSLADIAVGCCLGWLDFRRPGEVDWHAQYASLARHYRKLMERAAFIDTAPQAPQK